MMSRCPKGVDFCFNYWSYDKQGFDKFGYDKTGHDAQGYILNLYDNEGELNHLETFKKYVDKNIMENVESLYQGFTSEYNGLLNDEECYEYIDYLETFI